MALASGTRLGPYEITAPLGAGGMGEVYRAHDPRLQRDIALKVLPDAFTADATARARLISEARSAAALSHPNVCIVHEVGEADGHVYIAMEFVEGQPLAERIGGKPLPVESVIRYGAQIADALAHAHERQVIHRDLKSRNVVITPDGRAKVLDFGLATRAWEAGENAPTQPQVMVTETGVVVGTPHYLAPELLRGAQADAVSDVWALGVLLHEMTSGTLPFRGRTVRALSAAILNEAPAPLGEWVPAGLRAVIARCLAKQPGERTQRAGEVRAALEVLRAETAHGTVAAEQRIVPTPISPRFRQAQPADRDLQRTADEPKYYVYVSGFKMALLLPQIVEHSRRSIIDPDPDPSNDPHSLESRLLRLRTVVDYIVGHCDVGRIEKPGAYVLDTLEMAWGPYGMEIDSPLVFFGGATETTAVGLGGSMTHVLGVLDTSLRTHSHSATPILLDYLRKKLELQFAVSEFDAAKRFFGEGQDSALSAVALAVKGIHGPKVKLEFLAKTLLHGEISEQFVLGPKRVILGTPLYVAYASPTTSSAP